MQKTNFSTWKANLNELFIFYSTSFCGFIVFCRSHIVVVHNPVACWEQGQAPAVPEVANPLARVFDWSAVERGQKQRVFLGMFDAQIPHVGFQLKWLTLDTVVLDPVTLQQFTGCRVPFPRKTDPGCSLQPAAILVVETPFRAVLGITIYPSKTFDQLELRRSGDVSTRRRGLLTITGMIPLI
jgi:hypothetical protein